MEEGNLLRSEPAAPPPRGNYVAQAVTPTLLGMVVALLFMLVVIEGWNVFKPNPLWEYRIESIRDEAFTKEINTLGQDGWELVFARRATSDSLDTTGSSKPTFAYEMIFRRRASVWH